MSDLNKFGELTTDNCPECRAPLKSNWVACPECGKVLGHRCPSCDKSMKPEWKACPHCGEGASVAPRQARKRKPPVSHPPLEDVLAFLRDDDGPGIDSEGALDRAEQIAEALSDEQFELLKSVFEWLTDGSRRWHFGKARCDRPANIFLKEEGLEKAQELAASLGANQFEVLKDLYEWLREGDDDMPGEFKDDFGALEKAAKMSRVLNADSLGAAQEAFEWLYDGGGGPKGDDADEALDAAANLAANNDAECLEKLKEAYKWARDKMELEDNESLRYAVKKVKAKGI